MFGKKQKKNAVEVTKLSSLIADNLHIVGDVHFNGGLRVDGRIEGNVLGKRGEKSLIVLSEKGCIVGRVHAFDAIINGSVSGDLEVEHFLELQPGARVSGNISYRQLQMECGATVEGNLVRVEAQNAGADKAAATNSPRAAAPAERTGQASSSAARAGVEDARSAALAVRDEQLESVKASSQAATSAAGAAAATASRSVLPRRSDAQPVASPAPPMPSTDPVTR